MMQTIQTSVLSIAVVFSVLNPVHAIPPPWTGMYRDRMPRMETCEEAYEKFQKAIVAKDHDEMSSLIRHLSGFRQIPEAISGSLLTYLKETPMEEEFRPVLTFDEIMGDRIPVTDTAFRLSVAAKLVTFFSIHKSAEATKVIAKLLDHGEDEVRLFAGMALSRVGSREDIPAIRKLAERTQAEAGSPDPPSTQALFLWEAADILERRVNTEMSRTNGPRTGDNTQDDKQATPPPTSPSNGTINWSPTLWPIGVACAIFLLYLVWRSKA